MMRSASIAGAAMALLAVPASARADVLQIGGSGAEWIAGGPALMQQPTAGAEPGIQPESMTVALEAAGPSRWRAHVAQLAAKYDISPALLEAVVWQESRWNERAVSPVGARGLAQLMPGTAAQMGVNPRDPMANLEGGARYLRMQLDAFEGDVEKALAAYNAGPARVMKAGGIPNIRETREYVAAIMGRLTDTVRR